MVAQLKPSQLIVSTLRLRDLFLSVKTSPYQPLRKREEQKDKEKKKTLFSYPCFSHTAKKNVGKFRGPGFCNCFSFFFITSCNVLCNYDTTTNLAWNAHHSTAGQGETDSGSNPTARWRMEVKSQNVTQSSALWGVAPTGQRYNGMRMRWPRPMRSHVFTTSFRAQA